MNVYVPPIIEKVYNIQGSTAAPGSGEYHRYRAIRRRERTVNAAMEKEYKERKIQKDFDEDKEKKQSKCQEITLRKKKRRDKKKLLQKLKQKKDKKNKTLYDPEIPLLEQLKQEIGNDEFNKLLNQSITNKESLNDYDLLANEDINTIKPNTNIITAEQKGDNHLNNNHQDNLNDIKKLFPVIKPSEIEYDNYEDYEDHLEEIRIQEETRIKEEEMNQVKIKDVESIIIHEED